MKSASAFSLVEVVLALGVAAVAFTSIMGLFPLGLDMSRETHEETQAALIAQSILGDLRDDYQLGGTSHTNRRVLVTNVINLANAMTNFAVGNSDPTNVLYLGFTNHTISGGANPGESGEGALVLRPAMSAQTTSTNLTSAPVWFQNGSNGLAAVARVLVTGTFRLADPSFRQMTVLDVMVETPGSAASSNRVQYGFKGGFR
jgi:type II secretory pathway pseudopilin PulG